MSRVGLSSQNKAMKKVGGALKMLMGEYRKMAGEQSLGGGAVSLVMIRGARCIQLFNQKGMIVYPRISRNSPFAPPTHTHTKVPAISSTQSLLCTLWSTVTWMMSISNIPSFTSICWSTKTCPYAKFQFNSATWCIRPVTDIVVR